MSYYNLHYLEKIKAYTTLSTEEMYKGFEELKLETRQKEAAILYIAKQYDFHVVCSTDSNMRVLFKTKHGFSLNCARMGYRNDQQRMFVWYKLRDVLPQYYIIQSAVIKGDKVIVSHRLDYWEKELDTELYREYLNGRCVYTLSDDFLYLIHLINTITENMKGA